MPLEFDKTALWLEAIWLVAWRDFHKNEVTCDLTWPKYFLLVTQLDLKQWRVQDFWGGGTTCDPPNDMEGR